MATREQNRDRVVASLQEDVYLDAMCGEAFELVFTGRTSAHLAHKALLRQMPAFFHIGTHANRPAGFDAAANWEFASVDLLLQHPNEAEVRAQLLQYTKAIMCSLRVDATDEPVLKAAWSAAMDAVPAIDEFEADVRLDKLRARMEVR